VVDRKCNANTLVDSGCLSYGVIDDKFVRKHQLEREPIQPRPVDGYNGAHWDWITEVAKIVFDDGSGREQIAMFYIVPRLSNYDVILGLPYMVFNKAHLNPIGPQLEYEHGAIVKASPQKEVQYSVRPISANAFHIWKRHRDRGGRVQIFAASLKDIEKALRVKEHRDPRTKLPPQYHQYLDVFDRKKSDQLPPLRGPQVDHRIELVDKDGKGNKPEPPWGPLYNMSREELLVLRKTLLDYLDKGFIRVSSSSAAAPVLFVKKPGGGLRFCCDYRALNMLSKKDRYPLPLIHETLERIGKARWFTKLDVIAAFHKIRIAEGHEWLTAFRTRFGLFEWLVTPFGLAGAPSTFQRYINWSLREYLDDFVSAYLDDVLVFTEGSLKQHRKHVNQVLERLRQAGLQLDIDKCEFEVQRTKYLGFILEAGKGVGMDPDKVKAILEWQAPRSVKAVRSFLGFANFYRKFIRGFSRVVAPLTVLTQKDRVFQWTQEADNAFNDLKRLFTTAPILTQFDPERETVVEADSSGYATGGTLSQYDDKGLLRPCAYFSRKNAPAECNYEIHDKELLAIICCLKEWEPELTSVKKFRIITDHRNLRYFTSIRRLTERQMRWADILGRYSFTLEYRPGRLAHRPDALSRREQDMPEEGDERLKFREKQLLDPSLFIGTVSIFMVRRSERIQQRLAGAVPAAPSPVGAPRDGTAEHSPTSEPANRSAISHRPMTNRLDQTTEPTLSTQATPSTQSNQPGQSILTNLHLDDPEIEQLWRTAINHDEHYQRTRQAVKDELIRFPRELLVRVSISECRIDGQDRLLYRDRLWVPDNEPLRTKIMQRTHDSLLTGHPGRNALYAILARRFFWPTISDDVRRFVRNCDKCGANTIWRTRRQGLLKPLPIPERKWRDIAVDFVDKLPLSEGCTSMMVIVDRLGKGVIPIPCEDMEAETVARKLIQYFVGYHGVPTSVVSDRGTQFVGDLMTRLYKLLNIKPRPSTAFHPQTDGQTERMNAVIEEYLRNFCNHAQDDWAILLPIAQLAINGRDAASTGISPFFLDHGYHVEPFTITEEIPEESRLRTPREKANQIVLKLQAALDVAVTELAAAQDRMERTANGRRDPAPNYRVGDKVWLDLRNVRTERLSKKLDARHAKYNILEKTGSHTYRLNTPSAIHDVFHTSLLRPAHMDPFPSQRNDDYQPPAELTDENGNEEYRVDHILNEHTVKRGRGSRKEYLVKWTGWRRPTWTNAKFLEDTEALDKWEQRSGSSAGRGGE
jgi:hypothetical protein